MENKKKLTVLVLVLSLTGLVIMFVGSVKDSRARVVFCDVGQGDGILFQQGTTQIVVDTGTGDGKMVDCLGDYVPFWDKRIEGIILSHGDEDHSGGQKKISYYYRIDKLITGSRIAGVSEQIVDSEIVSKGDRIRIDMFDFEILRSGGKTDGEGVVSNEDSLVVLFSYKDNKILLMGDASGEAEQELVWRQVLSGQVDILKVGHHGSATSTSRELLDAVKPKQAIISVGRNNRFGHPSPEVIERLNRAGVRVRRTDREGHIVVMLD